MKNLFIKIVQKIASRFKIKEDITNYLVAVRNVGQPAEVAVPEELLPLGLRIIFRGMLNNLALNPNLDWVLPYWVHQQYNTQSKSFTGRGHQLFIINCTHRNWTGCGIPDSSQEAVIDERGLIMPYYDSWSLDFWIYKDKKLLAPSQINNVSQSLKNNFPIIVTSFEDDGLSIAASVFANKILDNDFLFEEIKIKNEKDIRQNLSLIFSVRPYNVEGLNLVKSISKKDNCFMVNEKLGPIFFAPPDEVFFGNEAIGDVSLRYTTNYNLSYKEDGITCKIGLCSAVAEYKINLESYEEKTFNCALPLQKIDYSKYIIEKIRSLDISQQKDEVETRYMMSLKDKVKINIPDRKLQDSFFANLSYLLMLYDGEEITPGVFTYHHFWFRDAAYQVSSLDKMGFHNEARKILLTYPSRQRKDGFFYSQNGEWDANGQAIWTLYEHYKYTKDKEYLNTVYPSMKAGVDWIEAKRSTTKKEKTPHYGLLPPGLSAEHLGPNDYFLWDDFWALGGIRSAMFSAEELGKTEDKIKFEKIYNEFLQDIENSIKYAQQRLNTLSIPSSPYRRLDSSLIGSVVVVYPLQIFSPFDERVIATQNAIRDYASVDGIFFQNMAHSGFGTYLNMQYAQTYLFQRDKYCWKIINWLLEHSSQTYTWPEAINPLTKGGVIGDGHHGWAVADWLHLIRNVLFFEEEKNLILTPALPQEWIKEENIIEINNAPSYFGKVNFKLQILQNEAILSLNCNFHTYPALIEFNFPYKIKSAKVQDKEINPKENKLIFEGQQKAEIKINW